MARWWTEQEAQLALKLKEEGLSYRAIADRMAEAGYTDRTYHSVREFFRGGSRVPRHTAPHKEVTIDSMKEILSRCGYRVEKLTSDKSDREHTLNISIDGEGLKLGVISCTHLGSKFQQLTALRQFYQYAEKHGVRHVLHCGDLLDGVRCYDGHEYEVFLHGAKAQRDYAAEKYPNLPGVVTYAIAGNHDYSFMKQAGVDVLEELAKMRSDIVYMGAYGAFVTIDGVRIYLQHGSGGKTRAYTRSYKLQKFIEEIAPDKRPDIYLLGHYHNWCVLPDYQEMFGLQLGSFQAQTPHARRNGWSQEVGGVVLTIRRIDGVVRIFVDMLCFKNVKEEDY